MQLAIFIYLLTMLLLFQIVGNFSLTTQRPEAVSEAERSLWIRNNPFTLPGLILGKIFWVFALAYPIYWGVTQSIVQAVILLFIGNLGVILLGGIFKRMFRVPEVILVYLGIVLCPFLMVGIWFIEV